MKCRQRAYVLTRVGFKVKGRKWRDASNDFEGRHAGQLIAWSESVFENNVASLYLVKGQKYFDEIYYQLQILNFKLSPLKLSK